MSKPTLTKDEQHEIVRQEFRRLLADTFLPVLSDLFDVDKSAALKNDTLGRQTREAIYNRLVGRPTEQSDAPSSHTIVVNITRYDSDVDERRGSMEKGMERSTLAPSSSPPLPTPLVVDHLPSPENNETLPVLPERVPIPKGTVRLVGPETGLNPPEPNPTKLRTPPAAREDLIAALDDQDQRPPDSAGLTSDRRKKATYSLPTEQS